MGLARAYVAGDLDIEGDLYAALGFPELIEQLAGNDGLSLTGRQKVQALGTLVSPPKRRVSVKSLAEYVAEIVDAAPPLTDTHRGRLGALLKPTGVA